MNYLIGLRATFYLSFFLETTEIPHDSLEHLNYLHNAHFKRVQWIEKKNQTSHSALNTRAKYDRSACLHAFLLPPQNKHIGTN